MAFFDRLREFLSLEPFQARTVVDPFAPAPTLSQQIGALRVFQAAARPWRLPSITEALGVPAIQRAVTLIANTTGSLTVQGYRDGALMAETPRLIARPDPYRTPRDAYRDMAYLMASRGEVVLWIASRDANGAATALIVVPPAELSVEENTRNRLSPIYTWGRTKSTRYSPANPTGEFVHITYLQEPGALRGTGPLQMAGAAASVAVEAQEWAANFYASGGYPSILLKSALEMTEAEAAALKEAWIATPSNMPKVIDPGIEDVTEFGANPQSAQMLEARDFQNGDAARMFGIPGALLEFSTPGSSLTYQNLAEVWNNFLRGCLAPNYLEPIEQALADLMPRTQVARFYVEGMLRADVKTRYDVYKTGIESGVLDAAEARQMEGLDPGSVELAPIPAAAPGAVPASLPEPRTALQVRCDGLRTRRVSGVPQIQPCGRLLSTTGRFEGACPRCKKLYPHVPSLPVAAPVPFAAPRPVAVRRDIVPEVIEDIPLEPASSVTFAPVVNIPAPIVEIPPAIVNVAPAEVRIDMAPFVEALDRHGEKLRADLQAAMAPRVKHVDRDPNGRIVIIREEIA